MSKINQFPVLVELDETQKFILTKELADALAELSQEDGENGWKDSYDFIINVLKMYQPKSESLKKDYNEKRDDILFGQELVLKVLIELAKPIDMFRQFKNLEV